MTAAHAFRLESQSLEGDKPQMTQIETNENGKLPYLSDLISSASSAVKNCHANGSAEYKIIALTANLTCPVLNRPDNL